MSDNPYEAPQYPPKPFKIWFLLDLVYEICLYGMIASLLIGWLALMLDEFNVYRMNRNLFDIFVVSAFALSAFLIMGFCISVYLRINREN